MRRVGALLCVTAIAACAGAEGSVDELCTAVRADRSTWEVFSGFDPTNSERAIEQLRAARVTLGGLRDVAPGEVRDDLDVEIAYVQALIEGLDELGDADPAQAVEVVRQVTEDHPDVADAAVSLAAFSEAQCGAQ